MPNDYNSEDSDDDDIFNTQTLATTKRPSRAESKKQAKRQSFLDEALEQAENNFASQLRIQQLKIEHSVGDNDDEEEVPNYYQELQQKIKKSDEEEEEEGVFDSETRTLREKALHHDFAERAGRRHTIYFAVTPNNNKNHKFFATTQDAIADLQGILQKLPKSNKLTQKLQCAVDYDLVDDCLEALALPPDTTPTELTAWLSAVACSAGRLERHWGDAARRALERAILLQQQNSTTTMHHAHPNSITYKFSTLLSLLQCWGGAVSNGSDFNQDGDAEMKEAAQGDEGDQEGESQEVVVKNIDGLVNCLLLWEQLIPFCTPDDAAFQQCLKLIVRFGLDIDFQRRDVVGRVIAALLAVQNVSDDTGFVLDGLLNLGPGLTEDDAEDIRAWLVLTEALRLVPLYGPTATPAVLRFHAALAQSATALCLDSANVENQFQRILNENPSLAKLQENSTMWKALATVCAGLKTLINLSDAEIGHDPPHLLASTECLFALFETGMLLLEDDKEGVSDYFVLLDPLLVSLSRNLRQMVTISHIRRSDMLLQLWHQYNIVMHRKAAVVHQQKTMDSFFKPATPDKSPVKSPVRS